MKSKSWPKERNWYKPIDLLNIASVSISRMANKYNLWQEKRRIKQSRWGKTPRGPGPILWITPKEENKWMNDVIFFLRLHVAPPLQINFKGAFGLVAPPTLTSNNAAANKPLPRVCVLQNCVYKSCHSVIADRMFENFERLPII